VTRFQLALFLHVLSVIALVATHSVSMFVLFRLRRERDRGTILDLVTLSGSTIGPMYVSLLAILASGVWASFVFSRWGDWWLWLAIGLLVLTIALMMIVAKPYFERVKAACEVRPSGVPRVADEELDEILRAPTAHVITTIGIGGFLVILALMVFKPGAG
jgi:MFS family permease